MPKAAHLARLSRADVFLDTLLVNAHTGASDALWAGVPLISCPQEGFPSRVGASLLRAAGLPQLICADLAGYEEPEILSGPDPRRRNVRDWFPKVES